MKNVTTELSRWQQRAQSQGRYQTKLLAAGMASALAILAPVSAGAAIQEVPQNVDLTYQDVDIDDDGIPDLSCQADRTEGDTLDDWTSTNDLYCYTFGGARIWSDANGCLPVTASAQIDKLSGAGGWLAVCQLDSLTDDGKLLDAEGNTVPTTKILGIKTSGGKYGWIKVAVNNARDEVKAVLWASGDGAEGSNIATPCGEADCLPQPPPGPGLVVSDDDKIIWPDPGTDEIGFDIYCNGDFIAQLPADATYYYYGNSLKAGTYDCEINAIGQNGMGTLIAIGTVIVPWEETPKSRLFVEPDGSGSCTGRVDVDMPFGTSCASSDCQPVYDKDGFHQNCAPNCSLAFQEIGKEITLKPQGDPGCEFSSWGGHNDCADGKILVTTDNKWCVAYFRPRSTSTLR